MNLNIQSNNNNIINYNTNNKRTRSKSNRVNSIITTQSDFLITTIKFVCARRNFS